MCDYACVYIHLDLHCSTFFGLCSVYSLTIFPVELVDFHCWGPGNFVFQNCDLQAQVPPQLGDHRHHWEAHGACGF